MAFDEGLAERIRDILRDRTGVTEKKMFGGLAFIFNGHLTIGIVGDELMVRTGPEAYETALKRPHARKMDFTGKPLKGFIYVGAEGIAEDQDLWTWVAIGFAFTRDLPRKKK